MSPEKDAALVAKYPEIFAGRRGHMRETAMCWGFECGDGWYDLIDGLCAKLMAEADLMRLDGKERHVPVATQVKEKFGGLRFYVSGATDAQYNMISDAETASQETCETCGAPGETYTDGWWKTLCQKHADEGGRKPGHDDT